MALVQVTDTAFPGAKSVDFIGQMIVFVEPMGRYWGWSALTDALSYNALDVAQAETSPDRIVGLCVSNNEVLIFGERTIEPWAFAPTDTATFQLRTGSVIESGCASGDTIKRLDNSVFYLTNNGQIARLDGYTPRIVSTMAIEADIRERNWSKAFAFTWEDKGHVVYYITFPDGHTWGYDVRQGKWHRRESYGLKRWRINALVKSNGKWMAGDFQNGRIYEVEWGNTYEGCEIMPRKVRTGVLHNATNRITVHGFRVVAATGQPPKFPNQITADYPPTHLLVTGQAETEGGAVFSAALTGASFAFTGISQSTGATIASGSPCYYDGAWVVVGNNTAVLSTNDRATWTTIDFPYNSWGPITAGPDGWLAIGDGSASAYDQVGKAKDIAAGFAPYSFATEHPPGTPLRSNGEEAYMCEYTDGYYYLDTGSQGELVETDDIDAATLQAISVRTLESGFGTFYSVARFDGALYAAATAGTDGVLVRTTDNFATYETLVTAASGSGDEPLQLQVAGGILIAYCRNAAHVWTSADGFAEAHATGIERDFSGAPTAANVLPRQIAAAREEDGTVAFYIISGPNTLNPELGDKCVRTLDGLTFSAPVSTGLTGTTGIAASTDWTAAEQLTSTCDPMESGAFQIRYSPDGDENWTNWRDAQSPVIGQFLQPLVWRRLGMARHRVWEIMDTSNRPQDLLAASIIAE